MPATVDQIPSVGPGALDAGDNQPFVLSSAQWIAVQVYVEEGCALPQNKRDMLTWARLTDDQWLEDFGEAFANAGAPFCAIAAHCRTWRDQTYPLSVALASRLVQYNDKVPDVYGALLDSIGTIRAALSELKSETDPARKRALQNQIEQARQDFSDLLDDLAADAAGYAIAADDVCTKVAAFATQTKDDKAALDALVARLNLHHGAESAEVQAYQQAAREWAAAAAQADAEYQYDCIVAETTPSYGWIVPWGLIPAVVVAGVYGDRAVKALAAKRAAEAQLAEYNAKIARDQRIMELLQKASSRMHDTQVKLDAALPVIQTIRGGWEAIASDLGFLKKLMNEDIEKATLIVQKIDVNAAIRRWSAVAAKADAYRVHAYISVGQALAA